MLVSDDNQALLTDFGVSRMDALTAGYTTKSVKGNARWQAKEFFEIMDDDAPPPTHTVKTDIWAFGMTIYVRYDSESLNAHFIDLAGTSVGTLDTRRSVQQP